MNKSYFGFKGFKDLQFRKSTAFLKLPTQDEIREQVRVRENTPETAEKQVKLLLNEITI